MLDLHRRPEGILNGLISEGILNGVKASFTQSGNRSTEMGQQRGLCVAIGRVRLSRLRRKVDETNLISLLTDI